MTLFKKICGYLLMLSSGFLALALFVNVIRQIGGTTKALAEDFAYGAGYLIGTILVTLIIGFLAFKLYKLGLKLSKSVAIPEN